MRKKLLVMAATAAALTLSTAITAFAGSWQTDSWGKYYQNDDGSFPVYAGWFTDPADGAMYYMDPDGYAMLGTTVEGYWLGDDGRRVDKTEEDLQREAERKAYLASRPSPAKIGASADVAAAAVKTATAATGTLRTTYLAEMEAFAEKILTEARDKRTDTTVKPALTKNNTYITYGFTNADGYPFITSTNWKVLKSTVADFHENAVEITYHYDAVGAPDNVIYEDAFRQLLIASLGNTEGQATFDAITAERAAGTTTFDRSAQTDTGNSYTLTYRDNLVTVKVVCSEVAPASEETAEDTAEAAEDTTADTTTTTTSVIVAGQGKAADTTDEADDADTTDDTTANDAGDSAAE
ncbi:MAG: hypothetical protein PHV18_09060 [Lachnospiraceae bacterium]|nr:hypothetical protein [Lachnospiraceae bacterium]